MTDVKLNKMLFILTPPSKSWTSKYDQTNCWDWYFGSTQTVKFIK